MRGHLPDMKGNSHQIHHSLLRRQTFLGCDRELCMLLCFVCLIICIFSFSVFCIVLSLMMFASGYLLLLKMAKEDLFLRRIYMRNIRYQEFYTAQKYLHIRF
ncbi:MAG: conjugal transfer protein TrbD [Succinivibrio sp.]